MINGYVWPASSITKKEMTILYRWREKTKTPITELIRQAIVMVENLRITQLLPTKEINNETNQTKGGDT